MNNKKRFVLYFLIIFIMIGIIPIFSANAMEGFVPCGRSTDDLTTPGIDESTPCSLCHLFVLSKRIIDFVTINIIVPLGALMFIIGGVMLLNARGEPERIAKGKKILTTAVIGFLIISTAWLIVNTIIVFFTPAGSPFQNWGTIDCPVP